MFFCVVNATYKLKTKATRLSFERAGRETAGSYAEREREFGERGHPLEGIEGRGGQSGNNVPSHCLALASRHFLLLIRH
jgi:hypothetical protein